MGWINAPNGWVQLSPPNCIPPVETPTLLEQMGVTNPGPYVGAVIDQYCNAIKRWMLPPGDPRRIVSPPGQDILHSVYLKEKNWRPEWNQPHLQVVPYWTPPAPPKPPTMQPSRSTIFQVRG